MKFQSLFDLRSVGTPLWEGQGVRPTPSWVKGEIYIYNREINKQKKKLKKKIKREHSNIGKGRVMSSAFRQFMDLCISMDKY